MKRLRYILQHRYLFKILTILVIIIVFLSTKYIKKESIYTNETSFEGIIYKIKQTETKITIYMKSKENLVINYYDQISNLSLGDKILVTGELSTPSNNTIPNQFNYKKYLYYNDIFYIVKAKEIKKISNNTNIIYYIKDRISKRINNISKSNEYIKIFILGDSSLLDEDISESYRENGISHLFSISGMHISLFASILLYILKRISYNNYYNYSIVIIFLIFYSLLVGSSPSVIRTLTMYILFALNKVFNLKIKSIDVMCIVLIILLPIKPFYIYNISFQYSYTISFSLVLFSHKLKRINRNILKSLYTSLISFLMSFPICIYNFYQVNFLSILLNILLIPLVSIIIFPLSLISFIVPQISYILNFFIQIMEYISLIISKYQLGIINFPKPTTIIIILYYIFIILFIYNKKYIFIFILMIYHKNIIYFNSNLELTMLDVGQGDSIFLKLPNNKANILIDTGGVVNSNYSIINNSTIPYLKSIGINKMNYLILTHGDYDHMGEAINLVNNFKVEKVIFNCGPYNDLEQKLIKVLDKKKIKYYSCIKELNIDNNKLYFLQTKEYDNENDNSNVIYTEINGYKFMFMGDASITTEKEIINKYNLPDIDVLKVGHHGSRTSSSKEFINEINPKYSIISVGKNNRYGHPNKEVLNNLEKSKIYRTDEDGSIMFKIKNNKLKIDTCSP